MGAQDRRAARPVCPVCGEVGSRRIQIGRAHLAAVAADVGEAHIVVEDQDDVGLVGHGRWPCVVVVGGGRRPIAAPGRRDVRPARKG